MADVDVEGLCKEGRQLFRQAKYAQAVQFFDQALKIDPDRAEIHDMLGAAHFVLKNYEKAVVHFSRVSQLKPTDAKPLINLGAVYNRKDDFQKAADVLKRAVARDGKSVEAYYNMGIAYRGLSQLAMAISSYKEALKFNPRMLDAIQNMANCLLEQGSHKAAIEQYKKALEINPDFERAQRGLARAEEAHKIATANFSPFGRLVSEAALKQTPSQSSAKVHFRQLSDEEKTHDRQVLRRLMIELKTATEEFFTQLSEDLLEEVIHLNRSVQAGSRDVSKHLFAANEKYQEAYSEFTELRDKVQQYIKQLKQHEAAMKESG